eukprot:10137706-Ditylum_brightwellii.AAC.1
MTGKEATESTLVATTAPIIGEAKEAAAQLQAKIDAVTAEITETAAEIAQLTAVCKRLHTATVPDMTTVKIFKTEFVDLNVALAGATIVVSLCRGIFKDKTQDKELATSLS